MLGYLQFELYRRELLRRLAKLAQKRYPTRIFVKRFQKDIFSDKGNTSIVKVHSFTNPFEGTINFFAVRESTRNVYRVGPLIFLYQLGERRIGFDSVSQRVVGSYPSK